MTDDLAPSDGTTLTEVLQSYGSAGFSSEFFVTPDGAIECATCGSLLAPRQFTIASHRRLEGASDPDDMIAVVATSCPACDARGVLVLGYGPMAAGEHADVVSAMHDGRDADPLPGDATPDEVPEPDG